MSVKKRRILIIAGEASGDKHAAKLVREMLAKDPNIHFFGVGGKAMREVGVDVLRDNSDICVVGFFETLRVIPKALQLMKQLKQILHDDPPDLVILVDYPGFNLHFVKHCHKAQVKVLYYISPQLWGWRKGRVKIIKRCVNTMAVVLPFEVDFYKKYDVDAYYVGHPLAHMAKPTMSKAEAMAKFGLDPTKRVICLLPGSRRSEYKRLMPTFIKTAERLKKRNPDLQFIIAVAPTIKPEEFAPYQRKCSVEIKLVERQLYDVLNCCDAAISCMGTVTLEAALMNVPQVLVYKALAISGIIFLPMCRVSTFGLCSVVAEERVAPELLQYLANRWLITHYIEQYLNDAEHRRANLAKIEHMKQKLTATVHNHHVADLAMDMLGEMS